MISEQDLLKASIPCIEEVLMKYVLFQCHLSCNSTWCLTYHASQKHVPLHMGFLNIFPLSDVNFIITWLITLSIFLGSLPGFISDQLVFTCSKGEIWASVIWRVHRKKP